MGLASQTRVGPYEILEPIGAGGMGEVYRARDTRLGRNVALKVLPAAVASQPDRMARFEREAHVLASLNHPGIATIHGFEEADSVRALVMELVPGPTLAERIARGVLPLEEALPIARQIAEALEYAHEHGIVHRDLKPANVKLTGAGVVKLLDFGLAKALADEPITGDVSTSPTLSAVATRAGIILGTAAYMSPEQAKGKAADRRSDIWSFGVVLYEMLSGKRMFTGDSAAETLASVLKSEPEWGALPATVPASVRRLLRRCLEKDVRRRLQAIGEVRIVLEDVLAGSTAEAIEVSAPSVSAASRTIRVLPWALAGSVVVALVVVAWTPWRRVEAGPTPLYLSVELGADASLSPSLGSAAVVSPDGKRLVFVARAAADRPTRLYVRRLDQLQASVLTGTDNASDPFFSPDSRWIGFFAGNKLKKIAATGGPAVTLCGTAEDQRGGSWSEDGSIVFAAAAGMGLMRVSADGGSPSPLMAPDPAADSLSDARWPQVLPGGRAVLFSSGLSGNFENASLVVQPLPAGPRRVVHRGGYHGRYLRSGHVVFMREGTLFAAPFDVERLELRGAPVPAVEGILTNPGHGGTQFAVSESGTLVFVPGGSSVPPLPILWLDKEGRTSPLRAALASYYVIAFSPDGRRLALDIREGVESDIWVYESARDTMSRLTSEGGQDTWPVWAPDGKRIAFASARADGQTPNLYWQRADGTGEAERLTDSPSPQYPTSWHPSGRFLAFDEGRNKRHISILELEGDEASGSKPVKTRVLQESASYENGAAFSPDGRWLAYRSYETGSFEVYVRPFPGPGGKVRVSTAGGSYPIWSRSRNELFFRTPEFTLMVAAFLVEGDTFRAEKPHQWSSAVMSPRGPFRNFDLHPDGQRFAVMKASEDVAEVKRDRLTLVLNFEDELRRIAPVR